MFPGCTSTHHKALRKLALASALLAAPLAHAAQLTLVNGDRISGEIISLEGRVLRLKSPLLGEVQIDWRQVVQLQSDQGLRMALADGQLIEGRLVLQADGSVVVAPEAQGPALHLLRADLARINPPVADSGVRYSGRATLGGTFNRGNVSDELLNLDAELVARTPRDRYTFNLELNEARAAGLTTTSRRLLAAQYDNFLSPQNYVFLTARVQRDAQADLRLRSLLGAGYGRQITDTERLKLSAEVGLNHITENYALAPDRSYPALSLGLNYEQAFWGNALVLFNNTDLSLSLQDSADLLVENKLGFRIPMAMGLNLSTQLNLAYQHAAPPGIKATDSSLIVGVAYAF